MIIFFAGFEVSRGRRVPQSRLPVLFQGAFLEKDFSALIENQNVHGPMHETLPMHFATGLPTDDLVAFIDHIEYFLDHLSNLRITIR